MVEEKLQKQINHIEETVDIIARAVAEGFAHVEEQFEQVSGKIDGRGRRIDGEVEKIAQIETRVRKVEEVVFPA